MSIVQRAVRGAAWTTATSMVARAFSLVATLLVTHKIAPAEYGQASAATLVALSAGTLSNLWLANYLIVNPSAGRAGAWLASWVHQLSGLALLALTIPLGHWLGAVLGAPELSRYLPGAVLAVALDRLGAVPEKILVRDMRFRHLAMTRMAGEMVYGVVTLAAAWLGAGGWALIYGLLARVTVRTGLFILAVPWAEWTTPERTDRVLARRMFRYGLPLWVSGLAHFIGVNWDNLLVSRYFGPAVMAVYGLAFNFAEVPAAQIGEQIGEVLLPSFALMPIEQRRQALVRSLLVVALVTFPAAVGLSVVSRTLVRALFDARWVALAPLMAVLCGRSITRAVIFPIVQYLQSSDHTRIQMVLSVGGSALLIGVIALVGNTSPLVTCVAVVACNVLVLLWALTIVGREGVPIPAIAIGLARIGIACASMAGAVLGARHLLSPHVGQPLLMLAVEILVGALVYPVAALAVCGDTTHDLLSWLRRGLGRRR